MVKLSVIQGGKGGNGREDRQPRLFSAYSMVDDFKGYDRVRLNWIYLERQAPSWPYGKLIDGYAQIGEQVRHFFEQYVKELFTEEEIEMLRVHLKAGFGSNFTVNEEQLPVQSVFIPMPYRQIKPGGPRGFFKPAGETKVGLPFDFCGYFDFSRCPPSLLLQSEAERNGVDFLRQSLLELGIDPTAYELRLKAAVERAYDEKGLLVCLGKTRGERIKERSQFFKMQAPPES